LREEAAGIARRLSSLVRRTGMIEGLAVESRYKLRDNMATLTENFSSWEDDGHSSAQLFMRQNGIATEAHAVENSGWEESINALLDLKAQGQPGFEENAAGPNDQAIETALCWLIFLRKRFPSAPPTCVIPEPAGGIIVERRASLPGGQDQLCELTFYNDGNAEQTDYLDGRIVRMVPIPRPTQDDPYRP
jgi:hypothetical protein